MPFPVKCPHCNKTIHIPDAAAGTTVKCPNPKCAGSMTLPPRIPVIPVASAAASTSSRTTPIRCPHCQAVSQVDLATTGHQFTCPKCAAGIQIKPRPKQPSQTPTPSAPQPITLRPEIGNTSSELEEATASPADKSATKWGQLGKPLVWNGGTRMAYGGILVLAALLGLLLTFVHAYAAGKRFEKEQEDSIQKSAKERLSGSEIGRVPSAQPPGSGSVPSTQSSKTAETSDLCVHLPMGIIALIVGLFFFVQGITMFLQPIFVPPDAPGAINGDKFRGDQYRRDVLPLLENLPNDDLYLGTYRIPRGTIAVILHAFAPDRSFLTPAMKSIVPSWWFVGALIGSCLFLCCLGVDGSGGLLLIPFSLLTVFPVCSIAILLCRPSRPISPEVIQHDVTRVDAGNPQSLYEMLRHDGLNDMRSAVQKVNRADRMLSQSKDSADTRAAIRFDWWICLESEPLLVPGNAQYPLAAWVLECAALVYCLVGAICALTLPIESCWGLAVAGVVLLVLGRISMNLAYNLRNTFRWKSDLFAVIATGTMQRQRAGGNDDVNFRVDRFHSQMHLNVLGTRVISENTTPGLWPEGNRHGDDRDVRSALGAARCLIQTYVDDEFRMKVQSVLQLLQQYHDREGLVMGAEEDSAGAQSLQHHKDEREQKKLRDQLQQQMQMMLFGKVLDKMTPEQLQQMMLHGGAGSTNQLPFSAPPTTGSLPPVSAPTVVPSVSQLSPEIEKLLRDTYRACHAPSQTEAARVANAALLNSLIQQFQVSPEKQHSLKQQALNQFGIKPS